MVVRFGVCGLVFGVLGLGFGVWNLGFEVWGLGFGVWGLGFGVRVLVSWLSLGFGVWGLGFRILGLGSWVQGPESRLDRLMDHAFLGPRESKNNDEELHFFTELFGGEGGGGFGFLRRPEWARLMRQSYRGTSLIRNCAPLRPFTRTMARALRWS